MARSTSRPPPTTPRTRHAGLRHCRRGGNPLWAAYHHDRTLTTRTDGLGLPLKIRRCMTPACPHLQQPYRPEAEGRLALPTPALGRDVLALVGALRDTQHRRVPEIPQEFMRRGVAMAPRPVQHLLARDDERVTVSLTHPARLQRITQAQGRGRLALDGLQPAIGHEVLWV
jgi:hypothetical protein